MYNVVRHRTKYVNFRQNDKLTYDPDKIMFDSIFYPTTTFFKISCSSTLTVIRGTAIYTESQKKWYREDIENYFIVNIRCHKCINTVFLGIMDFRRRCWWLPTMSYVWVNLQITRLQTVCYFFIWTKWGWNLLHNWINFKVQMYHTLIIQNVETWTWRHFRYHADCVPSLFSIEMQSPL